jgi:DNA polymerase IV
MYERAILHLDLDTFFVSVECLKNTKLKGLPVVIGGTSGRGVVSTCSYEARKFGVHSAMPMKMALRLCPQAVVVKGDMDSYSKYSNLVTDVVAEESPLYEKASIDEFYVDISGMDKHFGCYDWSVGLRNKIMKETGLPISFGLSVNKLVSKVGTGEAKPNGTKRIDPGVEKVFLAPLSVNKIPGVGDKTHKKLCFMGVRNIDTLSKVPVKLLEREFGVQGKSLWEKANAIDTSPVMPYSEQKSMSKERTFTEDTLDLSYMRSLFIDMTDKLAFELRNDKKLTSCITVKIRYADFNTFTKQRQISYTAHDGILTKHVLDLFDTLYERRQLIRLIGVKFSGLVSGSYQIDLFEDTMEQIALLNQMDHIRKRWGGDAIGKACGLKNKISGIKKSQ